MVYIYIYFNDIDPIVDGYYENDGGSNHPELQKLSNPHMVIKDVDGNAIWLGGCNCGYGGEGPSGSIRILQDMSIATDEIEEAIRSYDVVKIVKNQQSWEVFKRDRIVKRMLMQIYIYWKIIWCYCNQDILDGIVIQEVINKYIEFIPSPTEITIFNTTEQAREYGYVINGSSFMHKDEVYPIIIKDYTGRQLWLSPYIMVEELFKVNNDVVKIVDILGFNLKEDSLTESMKK